MEFESLFPMTPAALIAALCITSVVDVPKNKTTMAWEVPAECSPEAKSEARISESVAAAPVKPTRAKRKMASRCDGSKAECRISRNECGAEFNDWYWKKGRRKFRCR